ncbi:hypothetical protein [Nostoc sp.]|uniref:hypothetical protein n=1 Tax=Nostoc sp. TaxID=1180 RepID=UPI002FFA7395
MTPVASSRETLSAVPPGGNPQDRTASPQRWLPNAQLNKLGDVKNRECISI